MSRVIDGGGPLTEGLGMTSKRDGVYSDALMCHWVCWRPLSKDTLALWVPQYSATDMTGAIKTAVNLLGTVSEIRVFSGGKPDIIYRVSDVKTEWSVLFGGKHWVSIDIDPKQWA